MKATYFEIARDILPNQLKDFVGNLCFKPRSFFKYGSADFFSCVEIETITTCNRRCWYCPNSEFGRGLYKNQKLMEADLFRKIIDELATLEFWGRISPHFYGEPLLDPRIVDFVKYIRRRLPYANVVLYSNGDFLTIDLYRRLIEGGVDAFHITQHGEKMSKNMKAVLALKDASRRIVYLRFTNDTPLSDRGGLIKFSPSQVVPKAAKCDLPSRYVTIDYAGNCLLCCNDYLGSVKFGNLKTESLLDIWRKQSYRAIRTELKKGIYSLDICRKCNGLDF